MSDFSKAYRHNYLFGKESVGQNYYRLGINALSSYLGAAVGAGMGVGTGAEAGELAVFAGVVLACCSSLARRLPSPQSVSVIMINTVVITTIKNRSGFFRKNNGHLGLTIPKTKKIIVQSARSKEAVIIGFLPVCSLKKVNLLTQCSSWVINGCILND